MEALQTVAVSDRYKRSPLLYRQTQAQHPVKRDWCLSTQREAPSTHQEHGSKSGSQGAWENRCWEATRLIPQEGLRAAGKGTQADGAAGDHRCLASAPALAAPSPAQPSRGRDKVPLAHSGSPPRHGKIVFPPRGIPNPPALIPKPHPSKQCFVRISVGPHLSSSLGHLQLGACHVVIAQQIPVKWNRYDHNSSFWELSATRKKARQKQAFPSPGSTF